MLSGDLRRISPYLRPFAPQLLSMVVCALAAQVMSVMIPLITKSIIDGALAHHHHDALIRWSLLAFGLGLLEGVLLFCRRFLISRVSSLMEMRLRNDLYAHLQRLSLRFHGNWQSGQLLSRAVADANLIFRQFVVFAAVYFIANIATFAVVGVLLFRLNPILALVTAVTAVPIIALGSGFRRSYKAASRRAQDAEGELGTFVEEAALGMRVITTFGREAEVGELFAMRAQEARSAALASVRLKARFSALLDLLPNITLALVLAGGAVAVAHHALTIGGLVAFFSLVLMMVWPIEMLGDILSLTHQASAAAERIYEVFDIQPDITDRHNARAVALTKGSVCFQNVSFAYPGRSPVLDGVDLVIEPGETVALVGRTGCGKSTLCSLVPRLQDVTAGRLLIDGYDVRELQLASLRKAIGVAFEDPLLFSASVRENLLLGHADATDNDMRAALEMAQATFVYDLPWGLDTRIGEQGHTLSGGQRQRLALARAVVGKPKLLVLDDPLSALDVHTEALVHSALATVVHSTTTLISCHRPSTVALADRVAFLDNGRIVATGLHSELLVSLPDYRDVLSQRAQEVA